MKKRNTIILLIVLLAVGFAAVTTTLVINGNVLFGTNTDEFEVIFTEAIIDDVDLSDTAISEDGQKIIYETKAIAIVGDESKLDFTVKNNSTQYDADIEINCVGGSNLGVYYEITKTLPTEVAAQAEVEGNVMVKMIKSSVEEITEELTCTLTATAVERREAAVPEPETVITYSDEDSSGTRTIGDIVTISKEGASTEQFYILSSDETNTTMMSMYNLYVGGEATNETGTMVFTPYENSTGIQDSTMIGYNATDANIRRGVTAFSSSSTDYAGSIVEGYVNNYSTYLANTLNIDNSATLISKEELEVIVGSELTYQDYISSLGAPSWLYSTSYWTRSASRTDTVWYVFSDGIFNNDYYTANTYFGVRPVVTISTKLFENEEEHVCVPTTTCNETGDICWTDSDCSGTKNISDVVSLGTEENSVEKFYIISSDETNTVMMSMYNLYVGGEYNYDTATYTAYENPTGIQDSTMIGYTTTGYLYRGTTVFSSDEQKGTNYSDYTGSIVEGYVNNYSIYLVNTLGIENSATMISKEELESIVGSTLSNGTNVSSLGAPAFLYSTSYWTRSAYTIESIWRVNSSGGILTHGYFNVTRAGVRPVITISTSLF